MADDAAAAEVEQILCLSSALVCIRRLPAPLAGTRDGQRAVGLGKDRLLQRLERGDEAFIRLPILHADAVDLKLVDAQQAPELLVNREIHAEAGMAGENVP